MDHGRETDDFPPLDRRFFGIAIDAKEEPVVTQAQQTVEAAVRDVWELPFPTGEMGWWIFSIDHHDDGIRVELVEDAPVTDEVMNAARRLISGDATAEDRRYFMEGEGSAPDAADAD